MNNPDRPKVLITGAEGMLGFSLIKEFEADFEILTTDIDDLDIREKNEVIERISLWSPSLIIHAAAYTAVDRAEEDPEEAMAVNAEGTASVGAGAAICRVPLFYISTDYVFDGSKGRPYTEEDTAAPLNVYGRSKLAGEEKIIASIGDYLIIRTAWLFGPGRPNFVFNMANRAREGMAVRVVDDQLGSPTYSPHLARAIRNLYKAGARGIVNVVNSGICSWYDLTRETYRMVGAPTTLVGRTTTEDYPRPARRPAYSVLDTARYTRLTGNKMPTWQEALRDYLPLPAERNPADSL